MGAKPKKVAVTDQTPILLMTRPAPQSAQTVADIRSVLGHDFAAIQSPLIQIEPQQTSVDLIGYNGVIFGSVNAVRYAKVKESVEGLPAWCVGDQTASAAQQAGFTAHSAGGSAVELIDLILSKTNIGPLIHLRGEPSRGQISERLTAQGQECDQQVIYAQNHLALTQTARAALMGGRRIVLPVFSPNTAQALVSQGPFTAPINAIAISPTVADALKPLKTKQLQLASRPDRPAMVAAICAALGGN